VCFANEVGDICDAFGVDSQELMQIFLMDRKLNVSDAYLRPGFAFGGSCLPKDLRALIYAAHATDLSLPLLSAALPSNEGQIRRGVEAVLDTRRRRVGVIGLAFKAGTDDLRESPMVTLVEALIGKGCDVRILDRQVALTRLIGANRSYIEEQIPHIVSLMCESVDDLLDHADVLVIGNASDDAALALARVGPDRTVVDLTRGALPLAANDEVRRGARRDYAGVAPNRVPGDHEVVEVNRHIPVR
jgi:GDP-mannose 6-dehydrogenase